jgi:addiction module HigA family antidote
MHNQGALEPESLLHRIPTMRKIMPMPKPSHPGRILARYIANRTVTEVARHLGVARPTLSRLLHGRAAISMDMALRLSEAFRTEPDLWLRLQMQYDLWLASRQQRTRVQPFEAGSPA